MFSSFRSIFIDLYINSIDKLSSFYNNFNFGWKMKTYMTTALVNSFSYNLIRQVPLIEGLIVFDGLISAIKFSIEYIYYKIKDNVLVTKPDYSNENLRLEFIKAYNSMYKIDMLDRYIIYGCVYFIYGLTSYWFDNSTNTNIILYWSSFVVVLPVVQNRLLQVSWVGNMYVNYKENKVVFVSYSLSKCIISNIQDLDTSINHIQNYHIFVLYKYLTLDLALSFLKSYVFIFVLYYLRSSEVTYYYYKAIKLAYYYSTGYLFNSITRSDSIYVINVIVKEKRWFDIDKIEIVHAFYRVISDKYNSKNTFRTTLHFNIIKFCTLWSIVCFLKMFTAQIIISVTLSYLLISEYINPMYNSDRLKRYVTAVCICWFILTNVNDLIISAFFVLNPVIFYIFEEILFFVRNLNDIKKILNYYSSDNKQILKTYSKRLNTSSIKDNEYIFITRGKK
jgi:hypothetical protein